MKQKIIDIIGFGEHPEKAELMAEQILNLFDEMVIEQDKAVGALTRRNEWLQDSEFRRNQWLSKAKKEAGYSDNISFDEVWKEILEKAKMYEGLEK